MSDSKWDTTSGKPIGLKDHEGNEIRVGDLVSFWFGAEVGAHPHKVDGASEMIDCVGECDGQAYFMSECGWAAVARRYAHVCKIVVRTP